MIIEEGADTITFFDFVLWNIDWVVPDLEFDEVVCGFVV